MSLASRLADLNPFSSDDPNDDEDYGEQVGNTTVAGGGHSTRTNLTKTQLRVSSTLQNFLAKENIVLDKNPRDGLYDADYLEQQVCALLDQPHIEVPSHVTDRSHPLPEYFISSSHNTYLMAHQLFGDSSAEAYETVLNAGARCVEIDAWDNEEDKEEPKVTHGYTLVSHIPFRGVCEIIRDCVDKEATESVNQQGYRAAPILLSLENHCNPKGQLRLVQIMREVWGSRLLSKAVRDWGTEEQQGGAHVTLDELGSKIAVIVEHHWDTGDSVEEDSCSDREEDDEQKQANTAYKAKRKETANVGIIPELAEIGVYAQSVKPIDNSWYEAELTNGPHHHLINVSESGLKAHMPAQSARIAAHNAHHLMRVFPKGTRISSKNLKPVHFWGIGAQICALNWQTFGASMQINEALFSGSDGYVLKPAALRAGGNGQLSTGKKAKLRLHIAGASDVPVPEGRDDDEIKPYVTCILIHPDNIDEDPPKRKTAAYKHHTLGLLHRGDNSPATDPVWHEHLEWEYDDNELVFLRILIKSDDSFAKNSMLAVTAVRLSYVTTGWRFIRMLDLKGQETKCSLLVRFEIANA
ncbi:hypothetical protein HYALB_00008509 [Hymenoscyphus albidus]|uniref:Phosphoinositide phospholipase C n=1 Tax=Hymenoscyphus albidus TaxID=595503 RepID=A0A9N9Q8B8_9HELO|nr:hypothetical protein HYALB_00008509 [Hymenoscyphus albidus]